MNVSLPMQIGYFGKLPAKGDFIHLDAPSAGFKNQWDPWLQESIHYCQQTLGASPWLDAYLISPLWRFLIQPAVIDERAFAGFMIPSVDSVGRYFPFTVFCAFAPDQPYLEFILHNEQWFQQSEQYVLDLLEQDDCRTEDIQARLLAISQQLQSAQNDLSLHKKDESVWIQSQGIRACEHQAHLQVLCHQYLKAWPCLWWTQGSEHIASSTLFTQTLPNQATYLNMICGALNADSPPASTHPHNADTASNAAYNGTRQAPKCHTPDQTNFVPRKRVQSDAKQHPGWVREKNEDYFLNEPDRKLWAVADGMGGHNRGDIASSQLIQSLLAPLSSDLSKAYESLSDLIGQVNHRLYYEHAQTTGSTLALLYVSGHQALCVWAGDTRIYRLDRQGALIALTQDHSDPETQHLTRAIGADDTIELEYDIIELQTDDRFLICSDGLYNVLSHNQLSTILKDEISCGQACQSLINQALKTEAQDNITAIVIDV